MHAWYVWCWSKWKSHRSFLTLACLQIIFKAFIDFSLFSLSTISWISQTFTHSRQNMALICLGIFNCPRTYGENCAKDINIYLKKYMKKNKKHVCFILFVLSIHVALAAYVLILWKTFMFGHSCNYTVVLSKNVPTWNKTIWLFFITLLLFLVVVLLVY